MFASFVPFLTEEEKTSSKRPLTLGIELETPIRDGYRQNFLSVEYRSDISRYYQDIYHNFIDPLKPDFLHFRLDGGLEIVSQPFSYKWYQINREIFRNILNILIEKGFKDNADGSGMHVHINKESFSLNDRKCLINFMSINKEKIFLFSERAAGNYFTQGIITSTSNDTSTENSAIEVGRKGIPTKEFRLFNSTLDIEKFFSNIEFVHSLWNYITKAEKNKDSTKLLNTDFENYISFVLSKALLYPYLIKIFMKFGFVDNNVRKLKRIKKSINNFHNEII